MIMKPSSEVKPLHKLNREFIIDMLSEIQNVEEINEINQINAINQDINIENISPEEITNTESAEFITPIVIDIEPPKPVSNKADLREIFAHVYEPKTSNKTKTRQKSEKPKKKRSIFSLISDILFYLAILTVMIAILTSGAKDGEPRMFLGKYAYFTVLTPSMQNEIPKGSFILVKKTDPAELKIGDNITFMRDATTSVTHKIVDIYENYNDSGARGFETKGTNNANPDSAIVYEGNIVGKVIFTIPKAGAIISELRANIYIVFLIFGIFVVVSFILRWLFKQMDNNDASEKI